MALFNIELPPGLWANGTVLQARGRYHAGNLIRWRSGLVEAIGGWQLHAPDVAAVEGACRSMLAWRDKPPDRNRWIALATSSHLYVVGQDLVLHDITPVDLVAGLNDAGFNTGYGSGLYGTGTYGTPRTDAGVVTPATVADLDTWGETLVFCTATDGRIHQWATDPAEAASVVPDAPTGVEGLFVTPERALAAFTGARLDWSDLEDNSDWTPSDTNQAGGFSLPISGSIRKGLRLQGRSLLLTDTDAWTMTYSDPTLVYGFQQVGRGCGVCAKGAGAVTGDGRAIWMGPQGFWMFDGAVRAIDCDVQDHVFGDLNSSQISKVSAVHYASLGETWWFYPSAASSECDRYVVFNHLAGWWSVGVLARTCAADAGVFAFPLMVSPDGRLWEHETGRSFDGATPYVESGPFLDGQGDRLIEIQRIVPDEKTEGDVTVTILDRRFPNDADVSHGPYAMTSPVDLLVQVSLPRVRYDFDPLQPGVVGAFRVDQVPGDPLL